MLMLTWSSSFVSTHQSPCTSSLAVQGLKKTLELEDINRKEKNEKANPRFNHPIMLTAPVMLTVVLADVGLTSIT
jgi:hypothetical protein